MAKKGAKQVEGMEHIPASELGGGFPPFAKETFASQLLWLVLVFVALYLLMSRVALPRIGSILEERRQSIDTDLAAAQQLKTESDAAIAAYEKALAEARGRAQTLANEAREKERAAPQRSARRWTPSSPAASGRPRRSSPAPGGRRWPTCEALRARRPRRSSSGSPERRRQSRT